MIVTVETVETLKIMETVETVEIAETVPTEETEETVKTAYLKKYDSLSNLLTTYNASIKEMPDHPPHFYSMALCSLNV